MANTNIDTSSLTAIITEFRRLQAKDSITPEALGSILQRIADLLATAGTSDIQQALNNWYNAMRNAVPYISALVQANFDRNKANNSSSSSITVERMPFAHGHRSNNASTKDGANTVFL